MLDSLKRIFVLIFLMISFISWGQSDSLTPVLHAQFPGGSEAMVKFIMSNVDSYIAVSDSGTPLGKVIVEYYIDESGKTTEAKIIKSSNNQDFDKQVIAAIYAMPLWKSAENREGKKVKELMRWPMNICMR